ncbi:MAG: hypothetical protein EOP56_09145 [Sphingobacteriales bacterium]|nr:MAG: hypothetical protein EOP56_09145 [Sphingobacteriales bacterium]
MLKKIRRQDCLELYSIFPLSNYNYETEEENFFYPKIFDQYIFTVASKSFKGHIKTIGIELVNLMAILSTETLIFLGDHQNAWRRQYNDHKPVKEALDYLEGHNIGKQFNGALKVDYSELPVFTKHLAWLTRCNAALPNIHFIDPQQNIVGHICKYGNLHLDSINADTDAVLKSFISSSNLISLPECIPQPLGRPHRQTLL